MAVIIEPSIKVDDIKFEADTDNEYGAGRLINEWGRSIPLVKIGDYVLQIGEILECHITVGINTLPTFTISVNDNGYKIREMLKRQIDKCVIFFGFQDWYVKFNGIITDINSDSGDTDLYLTGNFYQEPLYLSKQFIWKEKSVVDILKDICTETKMGLFTFDNQDLNYVPDVVINPNQSNYDFTKVLLRRYTNNIWCYDTYGYLHIGNIPDMLKMKTDTYTISPLDGKIIPEEPIIFRSRKITEYDEEKESKKIDIEYHTICSNFSLSQLYTSTKYSVFDDAAVVQDIPTDSKIGFSTKTENTFAGFTKHKFPFYTERINKLLCGNLIKINLRQIMYEIVPFSNVELELYLPSSGEKGLPQRKDEEHSGKKIIIGYSYDYTKTKEESSENHITQSLFLI